MTRIKHHDCVTGKSYLDFPLAITRKTTLASFNVNGLMTRTKDKSDAYRVRNIAKFSDSTRVDVMGV